MDYKTLNKYLGNIDLFLLDQILKGRFDSNMKILDAGCGEGRNLHYFLREGFDMYAVDKDQSALRMLQYLARTFKIGREKERFLEASIQNLPFQAERFDAVLSISVLHFAESEEQFHQMIHELGRVLRSGGILLIGILTDIGSMQTAPGNKTSDTPEDAHRFLLTQELYESILDSGMYIALENLKIHSESGVQSMAYLVLEKQV